VVGRLEYLFMNMEDWGKGKFGGGKEELYFLSMKYL
jgi:hypothetical protein